MSTMQNPNENTDRPLSDSELDIVCGGMGPVGWALVGAATAVAAVGAYYAYNEVRDRQQGIGTRDSSVGHAHYAE